MDELFRILQMESETTQHQENEYEQKRESTEMWRSLIFQGDRLVLDHAQMDYGKVFRFTMNALVELHQGNAQDYRVTIQNQKGELYFFAIGPATQVANYRKSEVR
jgi:hypothetical protein